MSAAGVIVAVFVLEGDAGFPVYQMVVSLLMIIVAALIWYVPELAGRDGG